MSGRTATCTQLVQPGDVVRPEAGPNRARTLCVRDANQPRRLHLFAATNTSKLPPRSGQSDAGTDDYESKRRAQAS
jgi:hypothetical protein